MIERFVDTSGWAEWADQTLRFHAQAVVAFDDVWNQGGRFVTTSLVLVELTALLTSPLRMPKPKQIQLLDDLRSDPSVEVVPLDSQLESAAWNLWRSRPDKEWTLVDCASFVVMQQRGLTEALTTDHHFEQAGFVRLLK
jgi:predicted nucleic acid-binding protein